MKTLIDAQKAGKSNQGAFIIKKKQPVMIAILLVTLCSCSHYYYVANTKNIPLLREKNEGRISMTYGEGDESSSVDVQGSYAITDNIGVMANFMGVKGGNSSGQNQNWARGNYFDGAIGYFKPISSFGVFEVYGGYGGSSQHHQFRNGTADLRFTKVFLQPSFGLTGKYLDVALSLPVSCVSFNDIQNNTPWGEQPGLESLTSGHTFSILEPAFTIRGGWKYFKMQFQYVHVLGLSNQKLPFERDKVSLGLYISIARRFGNDFQPK